MPHIRRTAVAALLGALALIMPADAKEEASSKAPKKGKEQCTTYFFEVNDYGKEGPTRDAQALLDKLIDQKMTEKGVKKYKTGKKEVSCELFLDFVIFDEHTCKATAQVCWRS
jgi:hypothetical protein